MNLKVCEGFRFQIINSKTPRMDGGKRTGDNGDTSGPRKSAPPPSSLEFTTASKAYPFLRGDRRPTSLPPKSARAKLAASGRGKFGPNPPSASLKSSASAAASPARLPCLGRSRALLGPLHAGLLGRPAGHERGPGVLLFSRLHSSSERFLGCLLQCLSLISQPPSICLKHHPYPLK